jgi:hypothetical protein
MVLFHLKPINMVHPTLRRSYIRILEKVVFYADNSGYQNKLFTFKVDNYVAALALLKKFVQNGNYIRSVFLKGYDKYPDSNTFFQLKLDRSCLTQLNEAYNVDLTKFFTSFN